MKITKLDKVERGFSTILYGPPGSGKTHQISYFPPDETLIINVDAGIKTLEGKGFYVFTPSEDLRELTNLYEFLRTDKHPFKYLFLDNFSELEKYLLVKLGMERKIDFWRQKEWGDVAQLEREWMRLFRELTEERKMDIFFIAWDMILENEEETIIQPMLMRAVAREFAGIVDNVFYLKTDRKGERYLYTEGNSPLAKTRVPAGEKNPLPTVIKNPNLFEVIKKLKGGEE